MSGECERGWRVFLKWAFLGHAGHDMALPVPHFLIDAAGSSLLLTYVSCPDLFAHLCIVNEISIYENLQFRISFMTFCYVTLPIYIHTPEGYSFSRKLYGINVRNLSTPPGTWYFLNSQRHDRWVSCANSERSNDLLPFCLWCCRELISVRRYSVVKVRRLR